MIDALHELELSRAILEGSRRRLRAVPPDSLDAARIRVIEGDLVAEVLRWREKVERELASEESSWRLSLSACPTFTPPGEPEPPPAEPEKGPQMLYSMADPDFCAHGISLAQPCFFCRRMLDAPRLGRLPEHRNPAPAPARKGHGITIGKGKPTSRLPE